MKELFFKIQLKTNTHKNNAAWQILHDTYCVTKEVLQIQLFAYIYIYFFLMDIRLVVSNLFYYLSCSES